MFDAELNIAVNGQVVSVADAQTDPLIRAVLLSLFTWRRAGPDDVEPGEQRMGWCGDSLSPIAGDKFGSRLWLLARSKLLSETLQQAKDYAHEALAWMVEDGVCGSIDVLTQRIGREGMGMVVTIYRADRSKLLDLRFADVWGVITSV
jgi:phage gp46-like protein